MSGQPKFTPGPWSLKFTSLSDFGLDGETFDAIYGADGKKLTVRGVSMAFGGDPNDEAMANTRLIAAAPDLYEALVEFLKTGWEPNTLTGGPKRMAAEAKAQAALRKVIGEQP